MNADDPDGALERRVMAALRAEGLVRTAPHRARAIGLAVVLALIGAIGALLAIEARNIPSTAGGSVYILALYEGPTYRSAASGGRSRAAEYARWAQAHRHGPAVVVGGEELDEPAAVLGVAGDDDDTLAGFFLVRAASDADAVSLARTVPHLRYGGTVVVREAVR